MRSTRQIKPPHDDVEVATGWGTVRLRVAESMRRSRRSAPAACRTTSGATRCGRSSCGIGEQAIADRRGEDAAPLGFAEELRADKAFQRALGTWWPAVSAPTLVRKLLSSPSTLRAAAAGPADRRRAASILRKATKRADDEPWTAADLVLVDEAQAVADGARHTYGHIVVDEAQDLTAMELRALARRCPRRSMTVLGDLAQATRPGGQRSWDAALDHLGSPDGARDHRAGPRLPGARAGHRLRQPAAARGRARRSPVAVGAARGRGAGRRSGRSRRARGDRPASGRRAGGVVDDGRRGRARGAGSVLERVAGRRARRVAGGGEGVGVRRGGRGRACARGAGGRRPPRRPPAPVRRADQRGADLDGRARAAAARRAHLAFGPCSGPTTRC